MRPYRLTPVRLDRPRALRLTLGAYRRILEDTGVDLYAAGGIQALEVRHLGVAVHAMLSHRDAEQPALTLEDVEHWVDADNIGPVLGAVYAAVGADLPQPEAEMEPEPEEGSDADAPLASATRAASSSTRSGRSRGWIWPWQRRSSGS